MANKTIHLTPKEAARVENNLRGKIQKCKELAGQHREPKDINLQLKQVTQASFLADIASVAGEDQPDTVTALVVGRPYPPCTTSVEELQPIKLCDLRIESHHRGSVVTVRRIADVVQLAASSWTVVREESSGETERLEVALHGLRNGQDILESASVFRIKEPYFTLSDQGEATIRIDHPSDLAICNDAAQTGDSEVKDSATTSSISGSKSAKECKEHGNAALKRQALSEAYAHYSQGLQLIDRNATLKDTLVYDLFRNRALVNLGLCRFDEAKSDALASVTGLQDQKHKDLDGKAYFRAGRAAYSLGDFNEAKRLFEEQKAIVPGDKDAIVSLRKTRMRINEQMSGEYDFRKIKAGLLLAPPPVDAASFTRNCEIKESPGRGRGLFAARDIESGGIIICEKPFCVVWGYDTAALTAMTFDARDEKMRLFPAGLSKAIVQKLRSNPSEIERVMDLYGDYKGLERQVLVMDSGPVVDVFQVHDIVARNAFGPDSAYTARHDRGEDARNASTGLWVLAAYINHSCVPNARKEYLGDLMVLRATRPVKAGEEITHCYDESSNYDTRTESFLKTWGFTCTCALCAAGKADGKTLRKKRHELEDQAEAFMAGNEAFKSKSFAVLKAKRLAKSINDTYDNERYKGLPRIAVMRIQNWIDEIMVRV